MAELTAAPQGASGPVTDPPSPGRAGGDAEAHTIQSDAATAGPAAALSQASGGHAARCEGSAEERGAAGTAAAAERPVERSDAAVPQAGVPRQGGALVQAGGASGLADEDYCRRVVVPFLACGSLEWDSDMTYDLPEAEAGSGRAAESLEPVQPPIAPHYKEALHRENRWKFG